MSGDEERVTVRMDRDLVAALDAVADTASTSRSDLVRKGAHFVVESQAERLERQGQLVEQERQQVEANRKRRNIVRFPNTVRDLFLEDLKADVRPEKLPALAEGYRRQARTKEDLAAELDPDDPVVEPGELVEDVDRELAYAVEAADLSNWYDQHRNPYAAELSGVRDGIEEREDLVALVAGLVDTHASLCRAFSDPDDAPAVDAADLPPMAATLLPENVTKEDVADLATDLARQGLTGDQVRDVLDGSPLDPDAIEVESTVEPDDDAPEATVTMGGLPRPLDPDEDDDQEPAPDGGPVAIEASADTQARLQQAIAAADGGRTPSARRSGWNQPEEDSDMSHDNTDADSIEYDDENDAAERLAMLSQATHEAAEQAGGAADE